MIQYKNKVHWLQCCYNKIQRKYDWWIYRRAFHSLRRITLNNPGLSYLMELQMHEWNKNLNISPNLKRATEQFHAAMTDAEKQNKQAEIDAIVGQL